MSIFPRTSSHQCLSVTHIGLGKTQALGQKLKKKCRPPEEISPEMETARSSSNRTNLETRNTGEISLSSLLWSMGTQELIFNILLSCGFYYLRGSLFEKRQAEGEICPLPIFSRPSIASLVYTIGSGNLPQGSLAWVLVKQTPFAVSAHTPCLQAGALLLQNSAATLSRPCCTDHLFTSWISR